MCGIFTCIYQKNCPNVGKLYHTGPYIEHLGMKIVRIRWVAQHLQVFAQTYNRSLVLGQTLGEKKQQEEECKVDRQRVTWWLMVVSS